MQTRSKHFGNKQQVAEEIDLQPLFFQLTLDVTTIVLFGRSVDNSMAQNGKTIDEKSSADAFDHAQHQLARRGRVGDLYWLLDGIEFRRSCKMVHDFVDNIVHHALEETKGQQVQNRPERDVVFRELIAQTRDPVVLRDQLINVLLAGRDTTACLLSWTL